MQDLLMNAYCKKITVLATFLLSIHVKAQEISDFGVDPYVSSVDVDVFLIREISIFASYIFPGLQ